MSVIFAPSGTRRSSSRPLPFAGLWSLVSAALLAAVMACALGGCISLSPGPPPRRLQLDPPLPAARATAATGHQIVVAMPAAVRSIDTDGIALVFHDHEVRYLADARWTGTAPHLIQRALMDALEASGAFAGVSDEGAGMAADLRLITDARVMSLSYPAEDAVPSARFGATVRLLDLRNGKMLGAKTVDVRVPAGGKDNPALVRATEQALGQALAEIVPWVTDLAAQHQKPVRN